MKIDSTFRMIRSASKGATRAGLTEFRRHLTVNGKAVTTQKDKPPFSFNGGYVDMLDILTADKCLSYSVGPPAAAKSEAPLTLLGVEDRSRPGCASGQDSLIKASVDRRSFQLLHVVWTLHDVHFGGLIAHLPFVGMPSKHNLWTVNVSYAPVTLGDGTFWLPQRIATTLADSSKPISLHYAADYSDCHRYTATATILSCAVAH